MEDWDPPRPFTVVKSKDIPQNPICLEEDRIIGA